MPTFRTSRTRTGTRAIPREAPLPRPADVPVVDIGAGAVGRGLAALGRGVSELGDDLFRVDQEKQRIRDNASLASASGDYDKALADKIDEARRTDFTSIEQFTTFRKQVESDLDASVQTSIGKMSARAGQQFGNFAKANRQTSFRQIESVLWPKEILFGQSDTLRQYTNKFEILAGAGVPVDDILKDPSLKIIETGMKPYWKTGEMAKARERTLIDALVNIGRFDDARNLAQTTKAFTSTERKTRIRDIDIAERAGRKKTKALADIYTEQAHKSVVSQLVEDPFNVTFLDNLPDELQKFWRKQIEGDLDTYDPILYSGLKQQIRETPDKVDYMDIVSSVGRGLTPVMAQELFELQDKMQQKDSPLAQSHIKRAHDRINDLQNAGLTIKGIEPPTTKSTPEETIRYMNVFDEMHEAIDRNVDLKPAQMREFTEEMVRPVTEETGKGFWGILKLTGALGWQPTTYGVALGSAYMEKERLLRTRPVGRSDFEAKFKELYKVDPDTANKYWDRWEDKL